MTAKIVNIGTIPPRTIVSFVEGFSSLVENVVVDASKIEKRYICMDCNYETTVLAKMEVHQANHQKYHTLWQRIKRWWNS